MNVDSVGKSILNDALAVTLEKISAEDDCGNVYVIVPLKTSDPQTTITIAPADPDAARRSHPRSVGIQCRAVIKGQDPVSKLDGGRDYRVNVAGALKLGPDLPASETSVASTAPPASRGFPSASLEALAVARANYYAPIPSGIGQSGPVADFAASSEETHSGPSDSKAQSRISPIRPNDAARAAYWWGVAADEAERAGQKGAEAQYRLRARRPVQL